MPSFSIWFLTRPGACHPVSAASGGTQALNPGFQSFLALHGPTERQSEIWGVAEEKCAALCMEARACCPLPPHAVPPRTSRAARQRTSSSLPLHTAAKRPGGALPAAPLCSPTRTWLPVCSGRAARRTSTSSVGGSCPLAPRPSLAPKGHAANGLARATPPAAASSTPTSRAATARWGRAAAVSKPPLSRRRAVSCSFSSQPPRACVRRTRTSTIGP